MSTNSGSSSSSRPKRLLIPLRRMLARFAFVEDERRARESEVSEIEARHAELSAELRRMARSTDRLVEELRAAVLGMESAHPTQAMPRHPAVARLLEQAVGPAGTAAFVELAYAASLGRSPSQRDREDVLSRLSDGSLTPSGLVHELVSTGEFQENLMLESILRDLPTDAGFTIDSPIWPGTTERLVEIPWTLSRCPQHGRVLEIGYAYALPCYIAALLGRAGVVLHGVDAAVKKLEHLHATQADAVRMPYRDSSFGTILCVSTLEHLGRDNSRYGLGTSGGSEREALSEMHRVLEPGGHALITVPFGSYEDHGWFVQYDERTWSELIETSPFTVVEEERFHLTSDGWVRAASEDETAHLRYGDDAPGARAVLCATLTKR